MGVLKFVAKAAGTVVLTATGTASAIGEAFFNIAGNQDNELVGIVSEAFGSGKAASFQAIRNMWSNDTVDSATEKVESINATALAKKQMADTARRMAQQAKKSGNTEKYEEYMEKYEEYMDEYNMMREEPEE